jgi:hypothetical protein
MRTRHTTASPSKRSSSQSQEPQLRSGPCNPTPAYASRDMVPDEDIKMSVDEMEQTAVTSLAEQFHNGK